MNERRGILTAILAYTLWGLTPLYWALVEGIHPIEVVLIRTIMSFLFMILIIPIFNHTTQFKKDLKYLKENKSKIFTVILAGFVISINWGMYVYGVNSGHAVEVSIGFYLTPLITIILAFLFLRDRYKLVEWVAIGITVIGIIYMIIKLGTVPYIAFIIGLSFAFYSLIKSSLSIHALSSITLETLALLPFAIAGLIYMHVNYGLTIGMNSSTYWLLLAGAVTSVPLVLFSASAKQVPLSLMAFLLYIDPTLIFILGIFVFKEPFSMDEFIGFIFIWIAMILYIYTKYNEGKIAQRAYDSGQYKRRKEELYD